MTDPIRAALERLIEAHDAPVYHFPISQWTANLTNAIAAGKAALTEQRGEGERRWTEGICGDGAAILFDGVMVPVHEVVRALNCHRSQPPAEGEVRELVVWLHLNAKEWRDLGEYSQSDNCHRAAELLQQQHPTPVPVSERLPGPDDRNAEGGCWWFYPGDWPHWILGKEAFCDPTHWLPAHALPLPLPQGEVEK